MSRRIHSLTRDEAGATAIEYAMLIALVALAIAAALTPLGQSIAGVVPMVLQAIQ